MTVEITVGFVTDINELVRRERRQRIAARRAAWADWFKRLGARCVYSGPRRHGSMPVVRLSA